MVGSLNLGHRAESPGRIRQLEFVGPSTGEEKTVLQENAGDLQKSPWVVSRVYSTTWKGKYLTLGKENSKELEEIILGAHSGLLKSACFQQLD